MHPRAASGAGRAAAPEAREAVLEFVRERGAVHPREVDAHFAHGTVTNYWGGSSSATRICSTQMHYRGLLRVARREGGIRIYARRSEHEPGRRRGRRARARIDALVDVRRAHVRAAARARACRASCSRLRYAVPQWQARAESRALRRAPSSGSRTHASTASTGTGRRTSAWRREHAAETPCACSRRSIRWSGIAGASSCFWGWAYRFEAYTPAPKRKLGYYALPLLWRDASLAGPTSRPEMGGWTSRAATLRDCLHRGGRLHRRWSESARG